MVVEPLDLVVIGAGPQGLVAAKTYLQVHPDARVVLLETDSTLGGTWSKERLYKDLKTNNLLGTYEFPDFPFDPRSYNVQVGKPIDGLEVHRYLTDYAKQFGVLECIRFNTAISKLEKHEPGWKVHIADNKGGTPSGKTLLTRRVVVASGLTSQPNLPDFRGAADFKGSIIHTKDFGRHNSNDDPSSKVVVVGGAKSAYDAVYAYASAGHEVDWVIRPKGRGPANMSPSHVTPLKLWLEQLATTRALTWLVPCTWSGADGYSWARWFLHETRIGRAVVSGFGKIMDSDLNDLVGYEKHQNTRPLKPWYSCLQVGAALSILNYPTDVMEYVRNGQVKVHIADIDHLSEKTVHLSTGEALPTDVVFCATGWHFVPGYMHGLEKELGLPHTEHGADELTDKADRAILTKWPHLGLQKFPTIDVADRSLPKDEEDGVVTKASKKTTVSLRMHRFMVPPRYFKERSIAFITGAFTIRTVPESHIKALWITAFFDGALTTQRPGQSMSVEELEYDAALHAQSGKWTAPGGYAGVVPDYVFQHLPFVDNLLADLDVARWRKIHDAQARGGLLAGIRGRVREIFEPYMPADYRTVVDEWLAGRSSAA